MRAGLASPRWVAEAGPTNLEGAGGGGKPWSHRTVASGLCSRVAPRFQDGSKTPSRWTLQRRRGEAGAHGAPTGFNCKFHCGSAAMRTQWTSGPVLQWTSGPAALLAGQRPGSSLHSLPGARPRLGGQASIPVRLSVRPDPADPSRACTLLTPAPSPLILAGAVTRQCMHTRGRKEEQPGVGILVVRKPRESQRLL